MTRTIVVHLHLFKNAGTSVDSVLEESFGSRWRSYDLEASTGRIFAAQVAQFIEANPEIVAMSSHQIRRPLPEVDGVELVPLVFLRHPIDRIQSAYDFDRRRGPVTPDAELAAAFDFAGYVRDGLDRDATMVRDFQVRQLTDAWDPETGLLLPVSDREHFTRALSFVQSLEAVGVVDEWTRSWVRLRAVLERSFPGFDPSLHRDNQSPERLGSLDERLTRARTRLGPTLYRELEERNLFDMALYRAAVDGLAPVAGRATQ